MKYYLIRTESDPKIIGVKSGIAQVEIDRTGFPDKNMFDKILAFFDAFTYWSKQSFSPSNDFVIECARLLDGAILTDFLSFTPHLMACPFIVSERVKFFLKSYNIQEHYFFPAKIYHNEDLVDKPYYLLYCPYLDFDIIDFSKSSFYSGNSIVGKKSIEISTKEEYLEVLQNNPLIKFERASLTDRFDKNLDFFVPRLAGAFVSENLKKGIEKGQFTGIKIVTSNAPILEY